MNHNLISSFFWRLGSHQRGRVLDRRPGYEGPLGIDSIRIMDLDDMVAKAQATVAALKKITTGDSKSDNVHLPPLRRVYAKPPLSVGRAFLGAANLQLYVLTLDTTRPVHVQQLEFTADVRLPYGTVGLLASS